MARVIALHRDEVTFYIGPDQKEARFAKETYTLPDTGGLAWRGVLETDDEEMLEWFRKRPASFVVEEPEPKPAKAPRAKSRRKTKTTDEE